MVLLASTLSAFAQSPLTLKGTVTESGTGLPLAGASVFIENTAFGTVTDFDGNYSFTAELQPGTHALVFSSLGFTTQRTQFNAGGNRTITTHASLAEDLTALDEVVVTAMGIEANKKSLTNSIQNIKSEQLLEGNQANMVNGLQGKVSGVNIVSSGGAPGTSSIILIRGGSSITGNNQPLFVVDGIPIDNSTNSSLDVASINRASDINPADVESISVLKGPAAAALYGIQAASGAVIITTKKGKAGLSRISYSGSLSLDKVLGTPQVQTGFGKGKQIVDANGTVYDPESSFSWGAPLTGGSPIYYNMDEFYKTAITQNHNVSYSSGTEKGNLYFSIGDMSQDGIIPSTSYDKTSFKINANSKFGENLRLGFSGNYIDTQIASTRQGNATGGSLNSLLAYPVNVNAKDYLNADGLQEPFFLDQQFDNAYWSIANSPNNNNVKRFIGVIDVSYDFLNDFNLTYKLGTDDYHEFSKRIIGSGSLIENREDGYISQFERDHSRVTSNMFLRYDKQIAQDFSIEALVGHSVEELNIRTTYTDGDGFQAPGIYSIANVDRDNQSITEVINRKRIVGVFGDIKLGWKDALFLTATGRNDWTSTLPAAKRSFFYPSVGTTAIMTDLFDISSDNFNFLKLRATWAQVGKDAPIGALESSLGKNLNGAASSGYAWNGEDVGNPNLEPEFTNSYEFGADMRLLNNKIALEVTYYNSKSDNQILRDIRVPPTTGTFYATLNGGSIENKGVEALLTAYLFTNPGGFSWDATFNFGTNKSTVSTLPGFLGEVYLSDSWTFRNSAAGAAVLDGSLFGLRGKRPQRNGNGELLIQSNGLPLLEDAVHYEVNRLPDWTLGITNSFSYKDLRLSFLLDFAYGQDIYNATSSALVYYGQSPLTVNRGESIVLPGVDVNGSPNQTPVAMDQLYYQNYYSQNSENFIEDGSFARLRYVTLGYNFPKVVTDKLSISSLELYATGRNLLTITNYSGVDPDVNTFGAGISGAGSTYIDNLGTPNTIGFDLGLKFTF